MPVKATTGKCRLCGKIMAGTHMTRHLQSCLETSGIPGKSRVAQKVFHLAVSGVRARDYWMHLLVPAGLTLADLDGFLRDIWLECCGHLSAFEIGGQRYSVSPMEDLDEQDVDVPLGEVLEAGMSLGYEYDFGSTTALQLKVVSERVMESPKKQIVILARNAPLRWQCQKCGQDAAYICTECMYTSEQPFFCKKCAKTHECEMLLPITNSPRMGECGYCGEQDKDQEAYRPA